MSLPKSSLTLRRGLRSNSHRLDEHDEAIKEQNSLIAAIKELAVETKYMREDLNSTIKRLDKLESQDGEKWKSSNGYW